MGYFVYRFSETPQTAVNPGRLTPVKEIVAGAFP